MKITSKQDIIDILNDDSINQQLFEYADKIRKKYVGDEVHLRGLIEFSNICKRTCKYCGLRSFNKKIQRYRLMPDEIINHAKHGAELGYKTIVLQSGEDEFFDALKLADIIKKIKEFNVAVTLSVGEMSTDEYKLLKNAGADRYLLRIETTDKNLYKKLHPNMDFENRLRCLYDIKNLGFELGTGCLVGLDGQSIESLADDILFFKEIGADMIGIGPFISHPDTPLKDSPNGSFILSLKVMAIVRILLKNINIPATTAMETLNPNGRIIALQSGANVVMPNITNIEYRSKYEIYPNKICVSERPEQCRVCIENKIKSINRTVSSDFGFRIK